MNERIKELAEHAVEETRLLMIMEYKNFESKIYEKFAELIVRECARIADRKYLYSKETNRWDSGFNISCEILEQFGILENEQTNQNQILR